MINIEGLNKAKVLAALYNASKMQGMSFLGGNGLQMTEQQAEEEIKNNPSCDFDYLNGKVMKICITGNEADEYLYDRDNGNGAALKGSVSV